MWQRWWTYQRERFPVFAHGLLIAAFSVSAISYSALLRGEARLPGTAAVLVGFVTCFLFFLQLRIADEFKDFEEDARYRPYRPVPRGLVTLRELGVLGILAAIVQLGVALWLQPRLVVLLLIVWVYLALMTREFFVRAWLQHRPIVYMLSHMAIMPLIDFYATGCDWLALGVEAPAGLGWFLAVSYCNGLVIEIGRKVRAPQDEEAGVNTYTHLWGRRNAVLAWLGALGLTAFCAAMAAERIGFLFPVGVLLALLLAWAALIGRRFFAAPDTRRAKAIEATSGIWTLLMYLSLGAIPLSWRWWHGVIP